MYCIWFTSLYCNWIEYWLNWWHFATFYSSVKTALLFTVNDNRCNISRYCIYPTHQSHLFLPFFSIDDYYFLLFFKICDFSLLISKLGHCFNIDGGLAIGATWPVQPFIIFSTFFFFSELPDYWSWYWNNRYEKYQISL